MLRKLILTSIVVMSVPTAVMAIDFGNVLKNSGADLIKAGTISEKEVISESKSAVKYLDSSNKVSPKKTQVSKRLNKIVKKVKLPKIEGVKFNFLVYKTESNDLNAFATPDGSIRIHSGLMDAMTDDQVLAVVGHEIGHVVEKHSFKQMRKAYLSSAAIRAAAGESAVGSAAYNAGVGDFAGKFVDASFSKSDEISADKYALKVLKDAGVKPEAMLEAIEVLKKAFGNGGGMMSSHPSNSKRIKRLNKAIKKQNKT